MKMGKKSSSQKRDLGPWPDVATARLFLADLTALAMSEADAFSMEATRLGDWLIANEIGPLAYHRWQKMWPDLAECLQMDAFITIAQNSLHFDRLQRVSRALTQANIPFALLKGAALAKTRYPDPALRTMSDVDIWIRAADMEPAYRLINQLGFTAQGNEKRPPKLQALALGEIQFYDEQGGLVELHWSPVSGWLLQNTAVIDIDAMWARTRPFGEARVLAVEDMIIQIALHTAVHHRFRLAAVRSFIDMAMIAQTEDVDWPVIVARARQWRVKTAVWCSLKLAQQIVGFSVIGEALRQLQPSRLRQFLIGRFVSAASILRGDDFLGDPMQNTAIGYLFLLLLIDRPVDTLKIVWRALWPTQSWLQARYGAGANHWQHIRYLLRQRRI